MNFLKFRNLSIFFLILIIFISSIYIYFSYQNNGDFDLQQKIDFYVKNKSWNTEEQQEVPYKKGDEIEYTFIFRNYDNFSKKIDIALKELKNNLNLENISITGDKSLSGDGASTVKILGKTTESGISSKDFDKIFDFKETNSTSDKINQTSNSKDNQKLKKDDKLEDKDSENKKNILLKTGDSNINLSFENNSFFSDIDNLIKISGTGLENINSVGIGDKSFKLFSKNNKNYIYIPKGSLDTGRYFTFAVKENDEVVGLNHAINFQYSKGKVVVLDIFPPKIKNDIPRWITVQGEGLKNTISVQLSNSSIFKDTTDYKIVSNNVIAVKIPSGLSTGKYYINVMTTDGIYKFENQTFEVY